MSKTLTVAALAMLLATGAVASIEDADGHTLLDRIVGQAEDTVNRTMADLSPVPLRPVEVYGETADHRVHRVILLVRVEGTIEVDRLDLLHQGQAVGWDVARVLRDEDGSMEGGIATGGDLLRVEADLDVPLAAGATMSLTLDAADHRPAKWLLEAPRNTGPSLVALLHSVRF